MKGPWLITIVLWMRSPTGSSELRAHIPHKGGVRGRPKTCKGMFTHITQALNLEDLIPAEHRTLQKIICDLVPNFRSLPEDIEDISAGPLAGFKVMVDVKTLACNGSYQGPNATPVWRPGSPMQRLNTHAGRRISTPS